MTPPSPTAARLQAVLAEFGARLRAAVEQHCRGNPRLDVDDIEQEVRIRLWRAIESDRIESLHASYVQRVVVTTVIDAVRRAEVRQAEPMPEEAEAAAIPDLVVAGTDAAVGSQQQVAAVMAAIEQLPARRRLPLKLHLQGYAFAEIADLVGGTAESARKLVTRGMDELKTRLAALGMGEFDDQV